MRLSDAVKFDTKMWGLIGTKLVDKLLKRTFSSGIDVNNRPFKKYSRKYGEFRREKGRQPGVVDHTFTGRFQKNLKVGRTTRSGVSYGWSTEGAKVDYAEGYGRDILGTTGVSKSEGKIIADEIGSFIDKRIKKFARKRTVVKVGK